MALTAAVCWGANAVLVRHGMATSNATSAALLSISGNAVVLTALLFTTGASWPPFSAGYLFFVASGLLQPAIVRTITYWSYGRLGVARTQPIRSSTPLISVFLAILFLGEEPTVFTLLGTLAVIGGIIFISLEPPRTPKTWRSRDLAIPIAATCLAGVSQLFRKLGLGFVPHPVLAAMVTISTSWLATLCGTVLFGGRSKLRFPRRSLPYFLAGAAVTSLGQVLSFHALRGGDLSMVSPLSNTTPLFAMVFSALFLRQVEQVTWRVVLGAVTVVGGVGLILV